MNKLGISILGTLLATGITSSFLSGEVDAQTSERQNDMTNLQTNSQSQQGMDFKDVPRPDTEYWNKSVKNNGDEEYTASDSQVYRELRDKKIIKKDSQFESMLETRAKGGTNKYVVHKDGTSTIYLSNKWASRVAAGETGLVIALMGGGPYGALVAPLVSGAISDNISENGVKIHVLLSPTPVVKSVKPQ
ncbi:hypothetical protein [Staphylococcus epidermidis]|nr:hypothetical protein [Staphylococcus epidermidis]EST94015.1 hypothetical protein M460_0209025 [Staphylococcus epidermidis Scl31]EPP69752.1 hypothetical protein M458_02210 [Staphylococcus epidermidis Scl22]ESR04143.1 hypothetical protein M462_0212525 [Staphylococcus epidermidis CIM28]ESR27786.1 hypothetical protein M452_0202125 [Staphylococcus epidermidis APO35]ESU05082.1 hypothetical protein M461_0200010 [Staphylococcus epidermidis CIM37]